MARSRALLNILNLANVEELPVEKQFLNDLKLSIEKEDIKNARKPSQSYKPSSLHCIRNMYFQMTGADREDGTSSSELIGICESGTDRHDRIQKAVMKMKDNNIDCEYIDVAEFVKSRGLDDKLNIISKNGNETKLFNTELNMSFLCDGIIKYNKVYYILEIKTETSTKFWDRSDVNPEHILQGTAYSLNFGLDKVLFLYECRDNCMKKAYILNVTSEMQQNLILKLNSCNSYIKALEVPPKPADATKKMCAYCSYKSLCEKC